MEMGLVPGTPVSVVRNGGSGSVLQLRVRGYLLSLRSGQASQIEVTA